MYRFISNEERERNDDVVPNRDDDDARRGVILNASFGRIKMSDHSRVAFRQDVIEVTHWWRDEEEWRVIGSTVIM